MPLIVLAVLVLLLGLRGAVALLQQATGGPVAGAPPSILGLALRSQPAADGGTVLHATYAVTAGVPGSSVLIGPVHGPGIRATQPAVILSNVGGRSRQRLDVRPDCSSLDHPAGTGGLQADGSYLIEVRERTTGGRVSVRTVPATGPILGWATAISAACWRGQAHRALRTTALSARAVPGARWVLVEATLTNTAALAIGVGVIDVADVSSIDPADSADVAGGRSHTFRVRVAVSRCPVQAVSTGTGLALAWVVGPVGADRVSTIDLPVSAAGAATIERAARPNCVAPAAAG